MEFLFAGVFALVCGFLVFAVRESDASRTHVEVSGTLADYEVIGRRKSPALRFRLKEERLDFRVDPSIFREAMQRRVPSQFQRDAPIRILVMAREYAAPVRPPLNSDVQIAWVHGLTAGDQQIFSVADVLAWEHKNRRWSYVLFALALLLPPTSASNGVDPMAQQAVQPDRARKRALRVNGSVMRKEDRMSPDDAERLNVLLLQIQAKLGQSAAFIRDLDSTKSSEGYQRVVAEIMATIQLDIQERLWRDYPQLRPEFLNGPYKINPQIHEPPFYEPSDAKEA